jgi:hypothetical protein
MKWIVRPNSRGLLDRLGVFCIIFFGGAKKSVALEI